MIVRYSPTAVVTDRQAIKSSACDLATLRCYSVDNLISKSSWWTPRGCHHSSYNPPPHYQSFFSHPGAVPCADTMTSCVEQHCKHTVNWVKPHLQKSTEKQSKAPYWTQSLGSLRWCWSSENLNFSGSITILYHHFHHDTCKVLWTVFFLIKETNKVCQHPAHGSMVPGFLLLCLLPPSSSPTVLSQFLSLWKALVCLQPAWMLFCMKESISTREHMLRWLPLRKGQLLLQVRECKSRESRWEPRNVLVPWLETTYCCGCPAANPFLWLGLPLGGMPQQRHIPSPSLVEAARALLHKGWGLCLPGVVKAA